MGWLDGWEYRKQITINNPNAYDLDRSTTGITVQHIADKMKVNFEDVRFTKQDGTTLIDFVIFNRIVSNSMDIKCMGYPTIYATGSVYIFMYYGKADAADQAICAGESWDLCDAFSDEVLDDTKWEYTTDVTEEAGGYARVHQPVAHVNRYIKSKMDFTPGTEMFIRFRFGTLYAFANYRRSFIGVCNGVSPWSSGEGIMVNLVDGDWDGFVRDAGDVNAVDWNEGTKDTWYILHIKWFSDGKTETYIDDALIHSTDTPLIDAVDLNVILTILGATFNREWDDDIDYVAVTEMDVLSDGSDPTPDTPGDEELEIVAAFSADDTTPIIGQSINFTDASTANSGTLDYWEWDFGNGNTSLDQNPTHQYGLVGTYTVTLIVRVLGISTDTEEKTDYITVSEVPADLLDTSVGGTIDDIAFRINNPHFDGRA